MLDSETDMAEWTWPEGNPKLMFLLQIGFISLQFELPLIAWITLAEAAMQEDWKATESCCPDDDA